MSKNIQKIGNEVYHGTVHQISNTKYLTNHCVWIEFSKLFEMHPLAGSGYEAATPPSAVVEGFMHAVTPWTMRMHRNVATAPPFQATSAFMHKLWQALLQFNKIHPK
jgi:hypothetical protein